MHGKIHFFFLVYLLNLQIFIQASGNDSIKRVVPEISYVGDIMTNLSGGIQTGTAYLGMANLKLTFRPWKGGTFFINGANTHGDMPSAELFGDYQIASNIEAGNHTYLQELWYRHTWNKAILTLGLQDLNIDLANTSYGALFLNSSFGLLPTASANIPAPIFPLTSLGICAQWRFSDRLILHTAVFDGAPTDFTENPHNLKWTLSRNDGFLFFTELEHEIAIHALPGMIKAGIYLHQHILTGNQRDGRDSLYRNNNGFYLIGEQEVWKDKNGRNSLGVFIQLGLSPKKLNQNLYYTGIGVNYSGLLSRDGSDIFGLAVAHDGLRGNTGKETAIEVTYRFQLFCFLFLQPDIQYIINPAGTDMQLANCMAASLRFGVLLP